MKVHQLKQDLLSALENLDAKNFHPLSPLFEFNKINIRNNSTQTFINVKKPLTEPKLEFSNETRTISFKKQPSSLSKLFKRGTAVLIDVGILFSITTIFLLLFQQLLLGNYTSFTDINIYSIPEFIKEIQSFLSIFEQGVGLFLICFIYFACFKIIGGFTVGEWVLGYHRLNNR